jgi:hypothetical protein
MKMHGKSENFDFPGLNRTFKTFYPDGKLQEVPGVENEVAYCV